MTFALPLAAPSWANLPAVQRPVPTKTRHVVAAGAKETLRDVMAKAPDELRPSESDLAGIAAALGAKSPDSELKAKVVVMVPGFKMAAPRDGLWGLAEILWWLRGILSLGFVLAVPAAIRGLVGYVDYKKRSRDRKRFAYYLHGATTFTPAPAPAETKRLAETSVAEAARADGAAAAAKPATVAAKPATVAAKSAKVAAGGPKKQEKPGAQVAKKETAKAANEASAAGSATAVADSVLSGLPTDPDALARKLASQIIGNEDSVTALSRWVCLSALTAMRGSRRGKPACTFVPGPSGVGKTQLAKALAEAVGAPFFRFDMGRYNSGSNVWDLFGPAKGYRGAEGGGDIPNALRKAAEAGAAVLLFDECEKADRAVWQSMLAFLDEGRAQDMLGEVKAPAFTLCIFTSNLAGDKIKSQDPEAAKRAVETAGYFSPEFLGRIDHFAPMSRLSDDEGRALVRLVLGRVFDECNLKVSVGDDELLKIAELCRHEMAVAGARGAERLLKQSLSNELVRAMREGGSIGLKIAVGEGGALALSCAS